MPDQQPPPPPQQDAQNGKDPNHASHPDHPHHGQWLKSVPKQLGSAAIFGAGATAGADAVKGALGH